MVYRSCFLSICLLCLGLFKARGQIGYPAQLQDTYKLTLGKKVAYLPADAIKGYIKDDKGKWLTAPNRMPFKDPEMNTSLFNGYKVGTENTQYIEVKRFGIDSFNFYVMMIGSLRGYYKDPDLPTEKYLTYPSVEYYVIDTADWLSLKEDVYKNDTFFVRSLHWKYSGKFGNAKPELTASKLATDVFRELQDSVIDFDSVQTYYQIAVKTAMRGNIRVVRFYAYLGYAQPRKQPSKPGDEDFDMYYYEVPLEKWLAFIGRKPVYK